MAFSSPSSPQKGSISVFESKEKFVWNRLSSNVKKGFFLQQLYNK